MVDTHKASLLDTSRSSRIFVALSGGVIAGLIAAILDIIQGAPTLSSSGEIGLLSLQAAGRCGLAGALLSVAGSLAALLGIAAVSLRKTDTSTKRRLWGATLGVTAAIAPGCGYVAIELFQGGLTSRLPYRTALTVASAIVLVGLVVVCARIAVGIIRYADRPRYSRPVLFLLALVIASVAVVAHHVDATLYRRLYLYLHGVLGFVTLTAFGVVVRITLNRARGNLLQIRVHMGIVVASLLLFLFAELSFDLRQTVKVAAFEATATTSNLLQAFSRPTSTARRGEPSKEIIALREERNRKARVAAGGNYPVFPGAHILLVTVDAMRADRMGIYGHTHRNLTPKLDAWLGDKAVMFDRAYCTAPHSSFSITSFHTGTYTHDEAMLQKEVTHPTIAGVLNDAGYQTYGYYTKGIFFTEGEKVAHYRHSNFSFTHTYNGAPPPDVLTDRAIADIDRVVLKGEPPTFFWVHYFNVHEPYESTRFGTSPSDRYDGEIAAADPQLVRLFEHAEKVLGKGVIIALAADHGEEFKDHGGYYHGSTLYDEQVRVPLFIRVPKGTPRRITAPVSLTGLAPTLLKLVGISPASSMNGQDFRPAIFQGNDAHVAQPVFSAVVNQHMVLRDSWKLIFDPSSDRYSLFNLKTDPLEKVNLYDAKKDLANELLGELQGWLDEIGRDVDEARTTLNLGHMRDPRSVPGLVALVSDTKQPRDIRMEAAELLGAIRDYCAVPALVDQLQDEDVEVATAAALALGEMGDLSGLDLMREALHHESTDVRDRAALVLGKLGDDSATEQLIEALGRDSITIRETAIKMLGVVGDAAAVDDLIVNLGERRMRYLTVQALGKIGDPRAFGPLMELLETDSYTDTRGYIVQALGWIGVKKAVPKLLEILRDEDAIKWTPEALVRLGAVGDPPLFGTDMSEGAPALKTGWGTCTEKPWIVHGEYMNRTSCRTTGPRADISFPAEVSEKAVLILRARHNIDNLGAVVPLEIFINGRKTHEVQLNGDFAEFRLDAPANLFKRPPSQNHVLLKLGKHGTFEVDHFLVLSTED